MIVARGARPGFGPLHPVCAPPPRLGKHFAMTARSIGTANKEYSHADHEP